MLVAEGSLKQLIQSCEQFVASFATFAITCCSPATMGTDLGTTLSFLASVATIECILLCSRATAYIFCVIAEVRTFAAMVGGHASSPAVLCIL